MKKAFAVIMCLMMVLSSVLCGCSSSEKDQTKETDATIAQTEAETEAPTEETKEPTQKPTEKPTEDPKPKKLTLSSEEQYQINIFLSNFSEQEFADYDKNTVSDYQLIFFAHIYTKINRHEQIAYFENDEYMSLENVNYVLDRYFGKAVYPTEGQVYTSPQPYYPEYTYTGGHFYTMAAMGASHGIMTVVDSLTDLRDGTLKAEFKIYIVDKFHIGGNMIADKSYYYFTPEQAANSSETTYNGSGTAIVRKKQYNGTNTYELISYDV